MNRRNFLKRSGAGTLPLITGGLAGLAFRGGDAGAGVRTSTAGAAGLDEAMARAGATADAGLGEAAAGPVDGPAPVFLTRDGLGYSPTDYIAKLDQINKARPVKPDFYGARGTVEELLKAFVEMTGKEMAIFMPSGTLANQLAIQVLSGENSKVLVQETSHVYRDEADAAQSLYNKRLVPLAKGKYAFTLEELQQEVNYATHEEYFKTGIGAISIEIPVRRCDAQVFPIEEIKKISAWCREKGYKLHLDGARLHLASTWSGVSIREYASYFDTVYMCLYKYLGASSGAVLCGSKSVIEPMEHLVKVHGGAMYQNWANASMALHTLDGLEDRLRTAREKADRLFAALNKIPGLHVQPVPDGCNIYLLKVDKGYDGKTLAKVLREKYAVWTASPEEDGFSRLRVSEGVGTMDVDATVAAFKAAMPLAKV
ncbi:MAG: threonine aldolase [Bacteroidetes bacterium]|nr:threonine aldolase [Bacteroidota bacterium]